MDLETLKHAPSWEWPEDAGQKLLEILSARSEGEDETIAAAILAGDLVVMNDPMAEVLLSILRDDDASENLRGEAAIALGPALEQTDMDGFDGSGETPIGEPMFRRIQESLKNVYVDASVPVPVRRRVLEASVRAPQDWHTGAIRAAFSSDNDDWKLTAVFAMRWARGFKEQILEAMNSDNDEIHIEAICAAGNWEIDAAWLHVASLLTSEGTGKSLLLAALDAAVAIRPRALGPLIVELSRTEDEDVALAVEEAMAMANMLSEPFDEGG